MSAVRLARGVHAPRPRDQVRRLLPRPRRPVPRRAPARASRRSASPRRPACRAASPPTRSSCEYNDVDGVAAAVERYGEGLAAILVEPVAGNMGCVPPAPGFLEALRLLCDAAGALLVFDEVITGFRVARGGAQERFGVVARPDGPRQDRRRRPAARGVRRRRRGDGQPRAGRRRLPGRHAERQPARDRGRALGAAAAARPGTSTRSSNAASARLADGLAPFGRVQRVGAMLTLFAGRDEPVERFAELDTERYGELFRGLLERGDLRRAEPVRVPVPVARARRRARSTRRSRRWAMSSVAEAIADGARAESDVWARGAARRARAGSRVFSPLAPPRARARARDGLRGVPRRTTARRGSSSRRTPTSAVLLGDYLYAHGLVRVAEAGGRRRGRGAGRADLPLRRAARGRAPGDGDAWVDAARALGGDPRRRAVADALARHSARVAPVIFDAATEGKHVIFGMLIVGPDLPRRDRPRRALALGGPPPRRARARSPPGLLAAVDCVSMAIARDLREWIALLEREGELVRVAAEVDPHLEVTEIVDRTVKAGGPGAPLRAAEGREHPLLDQPVRHRAAHVPRVRRRAASTTSARGSPSARDAAARGARGEGARPEDAEVDRRLARRRSCAAARARRSCCAATTSTSARLPVQTAGRATPGRSSRCPAVITRDPRNGQRNVGMYRMQVLGPRSTAMHWQLHKDGRADYLFSEGRMEVAVALGLDPDHRVLRERAAAEAHRRVDVRRLPARRGRSSSSRA